MKYAMNLEMKGRPCLVLGGGPVALRKARTLLRAEAAVTVAAPRLTEELADLAAAGRLRWRERCYEETMLAGMFLVVCATDDRAANEAAARMPSSPYCFSFEISNMAPLTVVIPGLHFMI
ncbi:MAG: NAD(P)-dependent oxidoreductase [Selenomonadaceae bacterium]|nr:NAD(P)-dependent oxidoreductase [Selenomonadaceae bacterium]